MLQYQEVGGVGVLPSAERIKNRDGNSDRDEQRQDCGVVIRMSRGMKEVKTFNVNLIL